MVTFDQILERTASMGVFQKKTLAVVSLIDFSDGIEKQILGILPKILAKQWDLESNEIKNLQSIYFLGIVSGTLFCSFNVDKLGRQRTLFYSSLIGFICMIWMSLSQTILEMLGLRLFFGFIFGTTIPLGHIVITEIIAANIRGSVMTFIASVFIVGKIYATLLCMLLLDGYESGHWRILVGLNSIPLLLCCIGTAFIVRESPRFYLSQKNYQTAFQEIELISLQNGNRTQLSNDEKQSLIDNQEALNQNSYVTVSALFQNQYASFTLRMWVVFMLTSVIETTMFILMPYWLHQSNNGFTSMLYMMFSELCANMCIMKLIDNSAIGGRQKLVIVLALLIGISSASIYYFGDQALVIGMAMISFFLKMMFTTEMVIMNENYTTQYRSMGVGLTQTMGKAVGALVPYVMFPIFLHDPYIPFAIFAICMVILAFFAYQFPFDMTQKELDSTEIFADKQKLIS